jgi:hypothetical protein
MRQLLAALLQEHRQLRRHYRDFERSMRAADLSSAENVVNAVIDLLAVHGALERELLYPAARRALTATTLCELLEGQNQAIDALLNAMCFLGPRDEAYAQRFEQLCLQAMRHGLDEETHLFPLLAASALPWRELADAVQQRRQQLGARDADRLPHGSLA